MGEILGIVLTVLFGGGGLVSVIIFIGNNRSGDYRAREETQSRHAAERREVCASLLTSTRNLRNTLDDLRPIHDSLGTRFFFSPFTIFSAKRSIRAIINTIILSRSRLILDSDTKGVQQAIYEFMEAWEAFASALEKPISTFFKKADPRELTKLEATMNTKLDALETAARQFVNATPKGMPSKVKRLISAPPAWIQRITAKLRSPSMQK